jgi:hypothetical protein
VPTADEARRALVLITDKAVATTTRLVTGNADAARDALLVATPEVVAYYSDGSAALAADHYDELRAGAAQVRRYVAEPIVHLREEKIRTGVLWAVEPLYRPEPDEALAVSRIGEVVQYETARPFRDTITTNTRRDPDARGWRRVSGGGCKFCQMLAGRGVVYRAETARFAAHPHCDCTATPVFNGEAGEEASALQYVASQRKRTPQQQAALRAHLASMP